MTNGPDLPALLLPACPGVAVLALDAALRVVDLDDEAAALMETTRDEARAADAARFVVDADRETLTAHVKAAGSPSDSPSFELALRRKAGPGLRVIARANRLAGTELTLLALIPAPERAPVEAEHRRQAAWLRSLIAVTQDALVTIDRQGRIVDFNPAAERIFGYRRDEIAGQKVDFLMPEPHRSAHDGYIERYERTGEARAIGQIRSVDAVRKNGERFPIELSVAAVEVEGEIRYGAFLRDVSEKARLERELSERKRLAAIGATSAMLAHEVGNPLNNLALTATLLQRRLRSLGVGDTSVETSLSAIVAEIRRLDGLLDDFRALAKRQSLAIRPVDLAALVRDLCLEQRAQLDGQRVEIRAHIPAEVPEVPADAVKLKQVFLNLCKNAVEAMPEGGQIDVSVQVGESEALMEVTDNGVGIPEDLDVFEPFRTTKESGTGLGLAIARRIVNEHGGSIWHRPAESGRGTTFVVRLPRASAVPSEAPQNRH